MISKVPSDFKIFVILIDKQWKESFEYVGWGWVMENVVKEFTWLAGKPKYEMVKEWPWVEALEIGEVSLRDISFNKQKCFEHLLIYWALGMLLWI